MKIFAGAGESSGDRILAALLHGLRGPFPDLEIRGFGGPLSQAQGLDSFLPLEKMAVSGVGDVLRRGFFLAASYLRLRRALRDFRPDLVLLVDYPGMNIGLARRALSLGYRVHYVAPPQLWAYRNAEARVRRLKRSLKGASLQVLFPFEAEPYASWASSLCQGHFFALPGSPSLLDDSDEKRLLLCPGSRSHIVKRNLSLWLDHLSHSEWTGGIDILTPQFLVSEVRAQIQNRFGIVVLTDPAQAFSRAASAIAFPGTMTLELFLRRIPTHVWAVLDPLTLWSGRRTLRYGLIALPNLLLGKQIFLEWVGTARDFVQAPPPLPESFQGEPLTLEDMVAMDEKMGSPEGVATGVHACLELLP
jgi:lipid-A-disaccharide synthase